jgi:hypothetical protein
VKKTKVTLQRRVMIQNLSNLTKKLPLRPLTMQAWWESTKWISWKEFAQTGPEKVCDKVIINKHE